MSKRARRGECQECGREFALRSDGTIRLHDALQGRCPGSHSMIASPRDISSYFSFPYANFLVLHRVELEHMPIEWQNRFVAMLDELFTAYDHLEHPDGCNVYPCRWVIVEDLDEADMQAVGVTVVHTEESTTFYSADGDELDPQRRLPVPVSDPIPHYRRGHVEPRLDGGER